MSSWISIPGISTQFFYWVYVRRVDSGKIVVQKPMAGRCFAIESHRITTDGESIESQQISHSFSHRTDGRITPELWGILPTDGGFPPAPSAKASEASRSLGAGPVKFPPMDPVVNGESGKWSNGCILVQCYPSPLSLSTYIYIYIYMY